MPVHYYLPGVELYQMKPGLPASYKGPVLKGAQQCYITDNFGQTVNQSVGSTHVNFSVQYINWEAIAELRCHHDLPPGVYIRVLRSKKLEEKFRGIGTFKSKKGQFIALVGSSFTSAVRPLNMGDYEMLGLWISAAYIASIVEDDKAIQNRLANIFDDYPAAVNIFPLSLTEEMNGVIDELMNFDYTGPGVNRFLHKKMKGFVQMAITESREFSQVKNIKDHNRLGIRHALEIMDTELTHTITAKELAPRVGMTLNALEEGINMLTGKTFKEYLKNLLIIEAGRLMLINDEQVKAVSGFVGYKHSSSMAEKFEEIFWCVPFQVRKKIKLKVDESYVMSIEDKFKYGTYIANYMSERETLQDLQELNKWLVIDENHRQLFTQLVDETKTTWTRQWFEAAGIKHNNIRWIKGGGWYRHEMGRDELIWFYKWVAVYAIILGFLIYGFSVANPVID